MERIRLLYESITSLTLIYYLAKRYRRCPPIDRFPGDVWQFSNNTRWKIIPGSYPGTSRWTLEIFYFTILMNRSGWRPFPFISPSAITMDRGIEWTGGGGQRGGGRAGGEGWFSELCEKTRAIIPAFFTFYRIVEPLGMYHFYSIPPNPPLSTPPAPPPAPLQLPLLMPDEKSTKRKLRTVITLVIFFFLDIRYRKLRGLAAITRYIKFHLTGKIKTNASGARSYCWHE